MSEDFLHRFWRRGHGLGDSGGVRAWIYFGTTGEFKPQQMNSVASAGYFGSLFEMAPTYDETNLGTPKTAFAIGLNGLIEEKNIDVGYMAGTMSPRWNLLSVSLPMWYQKLEGLGIQLEIREGK
jgi:hypothetical protein